MTEVQKNREEIKNYLSLFYDNWWYYRDEGKYFDLQIPRIKKSMHDVDNQLLFSGTTAIFSSYRDLIINVCYVLAANKIASEIQEEPLSNYFRFRIRNPYVRHSIHDFFRFLDHLTFHLNELSHCKLISKKVKEVDFLKLQNINTKNLNIPPKIKKSIEIILNTAYLRITKRGKKILRDFRNIDEHRFPLGIDCLTYPFSRGKPNFRLDERYGRLFTVGDRTGKNYTYYGLPDIKFNELEPILKILAVNAKKIIQGLAIIRVLVQSY